MRGTYGRYRLDISPDFGRRRICHHHSKWRIAVLRILQRARCVGFVAEAPLKIT
jgi:hypothetical protein